MALTMPASIKIEGLIRWSLAVKPPDPSPKRSGKISPNSGDLASTPLKDGWLRYKCSTHLLGAIVLTPPSKQHDSQRPNVDYPPVGSRQHPPPQISSPAKQTQQRRVLKKRNAIPRQRSLGTHSTKLKPLLKSLLKQTPAMRRLWKLQLLRNDAAQAGVGAVKATGIAEATSDPISPSLTEMTPPPPPRHRTILKP